MTAFCCLVSGLLVFGLGGSLGAGADADSPERPATDPSSPETGALELLLETLRRQYPDRESVTANAQQIADRLLELSRKARVDPESPPVAGRAAILAAEVLFQGGRTRTARDVLAEVARFGPRDEDRAKALYLLGEHYFFLERYAERAPDGKPVSGSALYYWEILAERYPDSPWTERAARPLGYSRLVSSKEVPAFQATFETVDGSVAVSRDDIRGKLVVLDFWMSSAPGQKESEASLAQTLARELPRRPGLREKVVVLGVNLDTERAMYETARSRWELPWPQLHDGKGFQSPVAAAFAIPRVPHRALIDPEGKLAYVGPAAAGFDAAFAAELDALADDAEPGAEARPPAQEPASDPEAPAGGSSGEPSSDGG